jgi:seryl-tRNA synthetase
VSTRVSADNMAAAVQREDLLTATTVEGLWRRGETYERIVTALDAFVGRAFVPLAPRIMRFPPVMPREILEQTGYLEGFPQLIGALHSFSGDDAAHSAMVDLVHDGAPAEWTRHLSPTDVALVPAPCHPVYHALRNQVLPISTHIDLWSWCFRHEPSPDPARMQAFRIREMVFLGEPDRAQAFAEYWRQTARHLLGEELGLAVDMVPANDPFFGKRGRFLAASQRQQLLKHEMVVPVTSDSRPTAVSSINTHHDHFGALFGMRLPSGEPVHSACIGFGLDRITLALLRTHGTELTAWPSRIASTLSL